MPSSAINATSGYRPAVRERPRPPNPILAEAEQQWIFSEDELQQTPSIMDGMAPEEEKTLRRKGANFILQVGMMLKLPQTTLSTAAVFFNRFLMRRSLVAKNGYKPLHHYQVAATSLFLATKVEENCRKMKELVVACVRVALKDPNKLVDDQTKDFWRWRDTILYNEDVLLETICFDLSVEAPYKSMYDMLKYLGAEHNKRLRDASWAFLSDSCLTQLCLLFTSRTIAAASLYTGAKMCDVAFPDEDGKPWWEIQHVRLKDIRRACNLMADIYENVPAKDGSESIYVGLRTPEDEDPRFAKTRLRTSQTPLSPTASSVGMERGASDQSLKRRREDSIEKSTANGTSARENVISTQANVRDEKSRNGDTSKASKDEREVRNAKRAKMERNGVAENETKPPPPPPPPSANGTTKLEDEVSEEGEVEE
ncbi:cyclin-like protein [Lepidopterella palustris CBS 459.81]|uniref:RNA polymerase II holoenzyme cyclin-like subunit n=1 Tax=Lepidopterella palustris CBS 459.81 TaxID=1314670 RepID=A0A8E2EM13_9PEZI|nr:cyclin-like protein [Lepidopterella palustris CBS 459.81]